MRRFLSPTGGPEAPGRTFGKPKLRKPWVELGLSLKRRSCVASGRAWAATRRQGAFSVREGCLNMGRQAQSLCPVRIYGMIPGGRGYPDLRAERGGTALWGRTLGPADGVCVWWCPFGTFYKAFDRAEQAAEVPSGGAGGKGQQGGALVAQDDQFLAHVGTIEPNLAGVPDWLAGPRWARSGGNSSAAV